MSVSILGLGNVQVSDMFLCGAYKYGYATVARRSYLVRYDYGTGEWSLCCGK